MAAAFVSQSPLEFSVPEALDPDDLVRAVAEPLLGFDVLPVAYAAPVEGTPAGSLILPPQAVACARVSRLTGTTRRSASG